MSSEKHYEELAPYYDKLYHWKDYAAEAAKIQAILQRLGVPDGARLLDAACGTGAHLAALQARYAVEGFDLHQGMLEVARGRLPGARLWQADLRSFSVEDPNGLSAITCLFSSIGYLHTEADLRACAGAMARALRPGGVLLVEPWLAPGTYKPGRPSLQTYNSPELHIARATVAAQEGELSVMEMHLLIAEQDRPVRHYVDRHALWLCPHELLLQTFTDAGFDARIDPEGLGSGRGLLIGTRR